MKNHIYIMLASLALAFTATSCLDEQLPQTNGATAEQVANADKMGLVNGLVQYLNTPIADESDYVYTGIGYPEHIIMHDVMTADHPVLSTGYNYWNTYMECLYLGNWSYQSYYWWYYNALVYKAGLVVKNCRPGNVDDALALATGCAYRAFVLFDMTRMYEYKPTGTSLDAQYAESLKGLTVPIVNEYSDENLAKNNPRAPFYKMYRYILNDLQTAEEAIELAGGASNKNLATPGMVYGLMARFWLELGSRFERHPDDLATQIEHDNEQYPELGERYQELPPIGVKSAKEAFALAAQYARKAIVGYTPLTQAEWFDKSTGFNTANGSWIWAVLISASDAAVTSYTWESWVSYKSPEAQYGLASPDYKCTFEIDAKLYKSIDKKDWRRLTWIDPADWVDEDASVAQLEKFEKTFNEKYAPLTAMTFDEWKELGPYVGLKFRPGSGNRTASQTGNKVDIPLMRVEEMYFIEAEALAHTQGVNAGVDALSTFLNNYRFADNAYKPTIYTLREFERELLRQKRVEFWGEGVVLYDYKRLELPIERGYTGTNHTKSYRFNSLDGYVAPWTILYIPLSEQQQNPAVRLNPDPSSVMLELKY